MKGGLHPFNTVPTMSDICYIGIDSPNQTEFIYAQIVRDEFGYGGTVTRFNPLANTRQDLMDFMRCRPEKVFIVIGSAELAMRKFLVFYKFMEAFQVVSKEGVKALLEYEVNLTKKEKTEIITTPRTILEVANSVYKLRRPSHPRPLTPEPQSLSATLDGTTPKPKIENKSAK